MHSMVISPSETGLNNYTDNTSRCIDEDETAQAPTSQDAENVAALMSSDNVITSTDLIKVEVYYCATYIGMDSFVLQEQ